MMSENNCEITLSVDHAWTLLTDYKRSFTSVLLVIFTTLIFTHFKIIDYVLAVSMTVYILLLRLANFDILTFAAILGNSVAREVQKVPKQIENIVGNAWVSEYEGEVRSKAKYSDSSIDICRYREIWRSGENTACSCKTLTYNTSIKHSPCLLGRKTSLTSINTSNINNLI